jgi:hypothetical protein
MLIILIAMIVLALYGWLSGAWEQDPLNSTDKYPREHTEGWLR